MNEASKTSKPQTSKDSSNDIFSLESEFGPTPSASPESQTISNATPVPVPASLSALPAKAKARRTKDIFGQRGFDSSPSADLAWSLASKLRMVTGSLGSTLFKHKWSQFSTA